MTSHVLGAMVLSQELAWVMRLISFLFFPRGLIFVVILMPFVLVLVLIGNFVSMIDFMVDSPNLFAVGVWYLFSAIIRNINSYLNLFS